MKVESKKARGYRHNLGGPEDKIDFCLPRLIEILNGDDEWLIIGFLEECFDNKVKIEWVLDFTRCVSGAVMYIVYETGFKPTKSEIEKAAKKYFPEEIKDAEEEDYEWRVWKK